MHNMLREIAKVGIGLFIADIFCGLWLYGAGLLPMTLLGVTWTSSYIGPGIVFDLAVILLLAHYAWNTRVPLRSPSEKGLLLIAGGIFLVIALAHLTRLAFGVSILLGDFAVPLWVSWVGVLITAYLSYASFHFALRRR
jgi:hypothetical protein